MARSLLEKLAAQRATNAAAASDRLPISDLRAGIAYKIGGASDTINRFELHVEMSQSFLSRQIINQIGLQRAAVAYPAFDS